MSYPKDLDDYTDAALIQELRRRLRERDRGRCDYCLGARRSATCPSDRHKSDSSILRDMLSLAAKTDAP